MNDLAEAALVAGGVFNLAFVVFHLLFWRLFHWKEDLASLTPINRAVMQVLNLCLTVMFCVMAYVSLFHRQEMLVTHLGRTLLIAFALFWFLRMLQQIIFFAHTKTSHVFTLIFLLGCVLYVAPFLVVK